MKPSYVALSWGSAALAKPLAHVCDQSGLSVYQLCLSQDKLLSLRLHVCKIGIAAQGHGRGIRKPPVCEELSVGFGPSYRVTASPRCYLLRPHGEQVADLLWGKVTCSSVGHSFLRGDWAAARNLSDHVSPGHRGSDFA